MSAQNAAPWAVALTVGATWTLSVRAFDAAPRLTVEPASGLRDRTVVSVHGEGFDVSVRTNARLCRAGTDSPSACLPAGRPPITSDTGDFDQDVTVYAGFGTMEGEWIDCQAPGSCEVVVFLGRAGSPPARAPLTFAPDQAMARPALVLAGATAPLRPNQVVTVRGSGFDPRATISLQQVLLHDQEQAQPFREVLSHVFLTTGASGAFEREVTLQGGPPGSADACSSGRCVLVAAELQGRYGSAQVDVRLGRQTE